MKKMLSIFIVLIAIGLAYAQVDTATGTEIEEVDDAEGVTTLDDDDIDFEVEGNVTTGVTRQEDAFGPLDVIIDVDTDAEINEVAVCTTPEKDNGYVIASVGSAEQLDNAMDIAQDLFNSISGNETSEDLLGSRHFGCIREEVGDETLEATSMTATETAATGTEAGANATAGTSINTTETGTTAGQATSGTQATGTAGGGVTY